MKRLVTVVAAVLALSTASAGLALSTAEPASANIPHPHYKTGVYKDCWAGFLGLTIECDYTVQPGSVLSIQSWLDRNQGVVGPALAGAFGMICVALTANPAIGIICGAAMAIMAGRVQDVFRWAARPPGLPARECVVFHTKQPIFTPFQTTFVKSVKSVGSGYHCDRRTWWY